MNNREAPLIGTDDKGSDMGRDKGSVHAEPSPIDLINYCLQHEPQSLGLLFLTYRVQSVHFKKLPLPKSSCRHVPSGEEGSVKIVGGCDCGQPHSLSERCQACGEWVNYHGFKGRECRVALVEFELPERIGANLQLEPANRD